MLRKLLERPNMRLGVSATFGLAIVAVLVLLLTTDFLTRPTNQAQAVTTSFTETFATTTYKDSANSTAVWYGDGTANMGVGNVSSTLYEINNPKGGVNNYDVQAISCSSATVCYVINEYNYTGAEVLKTTDGGTTWFSVYEGNFFGGNGAAPYDIYAVPGTDVVYVIATASPSSQNMAIKSSDAGLTWTQQRTGLPTGQSFHAITCVDENTCVMVGGSGAAPKAYFTSNGGTNWTSASSIPADAQYMYAVGFYNDGTSTTFRMAGGGGKVYVSKATTTPYVWTAETSGTADTINDLRVTDYNNIFLVGGVSVAFVRKSGDAGATYAAQTSASTRPQQAIDCDTTTTSTCWSVSDYFETDGNIQKTTNGGGTWALVAHNGWSTAAFRTVEAVSDSIAYAAGVGNNVDSNLVKTSTSTHFTNLYSNGLCSPNKPGCSGSTVVVIPNDLVMAGTDGQTMYAVGDNGSSGVFGKTTNGGNTWSVLTAPGRASAIDCETSQICMAVGSGGAYHVTTNGGSSWATGATTTNMNDVDMFSTQAAWVAINSSPSVIRTENGGSTWLRANTGLPSDFRVNDVWAISTSSAYIAGYTATSPKGRVYYTGDGGASWTSKLTNTDYEFYKLHFLSDNSVGWAFTIQSGGSSIETYKSTNGGDTWASVGTHNSNNNLAYYTGVHFLDANTGFMATNQSQYLSITVNGGATWMKRKLVGAAAAITAYGNTMFISGNSLQASYGLIYKVNVPYATSTLQSITIDSASQALTCAGLTATQTLNGGTVTYEMSNDGGSTWTASGGSCGGMAHDNEYTFVSTGSDLRWRATLSSPGSAPTTTPFIDALAIDYAYNTPPDTPTNSLPANGASSVLLAPTLTSSVFSDTDGDTHQSSRWEISSVSGDYTTPIYATTSTTSLVSLTIPDGNLTYDSTYYWHIRYLDNNNALSSYSSETSFTTMSEPVASGSGDAAPSPASFEVPNSPIAGKATAGPTPQAVTWVFQDTASNELGFSIVDTTNGNAVEATTNPIFTQDIDHLDDTNLIPATQYCGRSAVAFNQYGNSAITPSSTFGCVYTLPAPPLALAVATIGPTSIVFNGITAGDSNPPEATYKIFEETTQQWVGAAVQVAAADGGEPLYLLGSEPVQQTAAAWGEAFRLAGLTPETGYDFVVFAVNGDGREARSVDTDATGIGGSGQVETLVAPVKLQISKTVTITRNGGALAAIATAADWSVAAFGLLSLIGVAVFVFLHRRHGVVRCVHGVCALALSPVHSYERVMHPDIQPVAFVVHRDVHRYTRTVLVVAFSALLVKLLLSSLLIWNPSAVFGAEVPGSAGQSVLPGDYVTYQITVKNEGPGDATAVVVTDRLPSTIAYMPGSLVVDGVRQTDLEDTDVGTVDRLGNVRTVSLRRDRLPVGQTSVLSFRTLVERPSEDSASSALAGTIGEIANVGCVRIKELENEPQCTPRVVNPIVDRILPPRLVNSNVPLVNINANSNRPIQKLVRTAKELALRKYKTIRLNGLLSGAYLIQRRPVVSGYAPAGDVLVLLANNRPVASTMAGTDGYYELTPRTALNLGTYTLRILDILPEAVVRQSVTVKRSPDLPPRRALPAGKIEQKPRRETTPALTGTAPAGTPVLLGVNGTVVAQSTAQKNGIWTLTVPTPLPAGTHTLTVQQVDGTKTTDTYTVAPEGAAGPESEQVAIAARAEVPELSDPTPDLVGEAPPRTEVVLFQDDVPIATVQSDAEGAWQSTLQEAIPDGDTVLAAAPTGGELTVGEVTFIAPQPTQIRIDGVLPEVPTNDSTPAITGEGPAGALVSIAVDGSVQGVAQSDADGRFTFTPFMPLMDGEHRAAVMVEGQELDTAQFVVDTIPPEQPTNVSVIRVDVRTRWFGDGTNITMTVQGETGPDAVRVHIRVQSDPVDVEFAPSHSSWERDVTAAFGPGEHTAIVTAYDAAGNASAAAVHRFVISEEAGSLAVVGQILEAIQVIADNPAVEQVAVASAPIVVVAAVANTATAVGFGSVANYFGLLFTQPFLLFGRRRRTSYGKVYNALNKLPVDLAIVRLLDASSRRVMATKVTDKEGRYEFLVSPGQYILEVIKKGFTVPSAYLAGKTDDVALTDVWTGRAMPFTAPGRVARNVPADPAEDRHTPAGVVTARFMRRVQFVVALSGPILSVVSVAITPTGFVFGMLVLQFAAFALFRRLAYRPAPKSFGVVRDAATQVPLAGVVVRVFETTYNKLLEMEVTDSRGRYAFLVGPNQYYVTAEKLGYATTRSQPINLTAAGREAVVAQDVALAHAINQSATQTPKKAAPARPQKSGPVL